MSRGFIAALFGIGMTIFSWYGPWEWPAWPAFGVLHLVFGTGATYQELPYGQRATVLVSLIIVNAAFWAAAAAVAMKMIRR